ncbi:tyrosine-type recombinase/integrase [Bythopirellula goksoeyrii]|uniref:Tyrosine recombinase XerC n=1 Tax=Bythopirellula goksoeyrii TaxID=1400387 RepID=A0A5B9QAB7_9BACT|nr:tyrosine-type recombinase/integrase [Bythopirellula goksoeyrii]QEG35917.1 Tyrosine recombinase XerC [Bythopirellula goksoeyrii]
MKVEKTPLTRIGDTDMPAKPRKPWYWKARKAWYVCLHGKQHKLSTDKKEAQQRFHELMASEPKTVTDGSVASLLDAFISDCRKTKAPKTIQWYRNYLQDFLDFLVPKGYSPQSLPASRMTPKIVRQWVDHRGTAERARITAVKSAYSWGHGEGWMEHNPLSGMKRPPATKRTELIELPEMVRLLRLSKDKCFRELLTFCWDVGCRPQEAKGLRKDQLDLERSRCVISEDEAKGKRKQRVIYLTSRSKRIIERNINGSPYIFLNTRSKPWTTSAVNCRFARLEEKVGKRYCQYMWRHAFATRKLKEGVSPIVVAELLGHADVSTLAKIYQHVAQDPSHLLSALEQRK